MLCKVLRNFPFAADHIHIRELQAGALEELPEELIDGLVREGYAEVASAEQKPECESEPEAAAARTNEVPPEAVAPVSRRRNRK